MLLRVTLYFVLLFPIFSTAWAKQATDLTDGSFLSARAGVSYEAVVLSEQQASLSGETISHSDKAVPQSRLGFGNASSELFAISPYGSALPPGHRLAGVSSRQGAFTELDKVLLSARAVKALDLSVVSSRYKRALKKFVPSKTKRFVRVSRAYNVGDIIVMNNKRRLYLIVGHGRAIEFMIAVGRQGKGWRGTYTISRKRKWPEWRPTAEMRKKDKSLKVVYKGGKKNPLGSRALYLGSSLYRIHGTNNPRSIGKSATSGCFRMLNKDVEYLYKLVGVGTRVIVN